MRERKEQQTGAEAAYTKRLQLPTYRLQCVTLLPERAYVLDFLRTRKLLCLPCIRQSK